MKILSRYIWLVSILIVACNGQQTIFKNAVIILSDDHALKVTGAYGNKIINTPAIDKLSKEGITFTRTYCNAPICSASRQSLLTGKYPHATGVNLLFTPFPDEGNVTIAEHLRENGYRTAIIGKTHWNNWAWSLLYENGMPDHGFDLIVENANYKKFLEENPPPSLPNQIDFYEKVDRSDQAERMNWRVLPHPINDGHSMGTFFANEAIQFLSENENKPFFLWLAFKEPHHPFYFPIEFAGKYKPESMSLPVGSPEDDRWIPQRFRDLSDAEKQGIIASYYTSTEYLDKNIGLVLDAIKAQGLEENTLIAYISDNGYLLNEHKRFEKHTMWEEAIRQPMIWKIGNKGFGRKSDELLEYIDVMPTILDYLGISIPNEVQGVSFRNEIEGTGFRSKEYAFSEYLEDNLAMICNKKWKYVFTTGSRDLGIGYQTGYGPSGIVHRLYDLENDPNEYHSVANENAEVLLKMQQAMLKRFVETHPDAENCPNTLTLEGKLVWFCEPRDIGVDQSLIDVPVRVFESK